VVINRLQERGFTGALGLAAQPTPLDSFEHFTGDPLNGAHAGHIWKVFFESTPRYAIYPSASAARVLAEYRTLRGDVTGNATVLTENHAGWSLGSLRQLRMGRRGEHRAAGAVADVGGLGERRTPAGYHRLPRRR